MDVEVEGESDRGMLGGAPPPDPVPEPLLPADFYPDHLNSLQILHHLPTMATGDEADPFDTILGLEDQYYAEGHALGVTDGTQAGRSEGRLFGMQKGYEKFAALGTLAAQAAMWEAQIEDPTPANSLSSTSKDRLRKHIATLAALTEFETLNTTNTEEAVADFDDRLKRAESKAKVIASILGDQTSSQQSHGSQASKEARSTNMEDFTLPPQLSR